MRYYKNTELVGLGIIGIIGGIIGLITGSTGRIQGRAAICLVGGIAALLIGLNNSK